MRSRTSSAPAVDFAPPVPLDEMTRRAWVLKQVASADRQYLLRDACAFSVDRLLARVARGRGALDVAMAEGLSALADGDRLLRLGYSCPGDYAREKLGVALRTAQGMVQVGRGLRSRPLLRQAVRAGEVGIRKAQAVLAVAMGEAEAAWVERARNETVRALEDAVRRELAARRPAAPSPVGGIPSPRPAGSTPSPTPAGSNFSAAPGPGMPPGDAPAGPISTVSAEPGSDSEDPWELLVCDVTPEMRERLDVALHLAGRLLGPTSPKWRRLEAMGQEYIGAHPEVPEPPPPEPLWPGGPVCRPSAAYELPPAWRKTLEEHLENEMGRWHFLDVVETVAAPRLASLPGCPGAEGGALAGAIPGALSDGAGGDAAAGEAPANSPSAGELTIARRLDAQLVELAGMRDRWDDLVGHLALHVRSLGLWKDMGFASFAHYCVERLGMSSRAVEQRVWLEKRLYHLPSLRAAMVEGRISYEKARILAGVQGDEDAEVWIERASHMTCLALRQLADAGEDRQMRAERVFRLRVPRSVGILLAEAFRAARSVAGRWLDPGQCLSALAEHFIETWKDLPQGRSTPQRRAVERDLGICQVPGCSRAAAHAHHIDYRSHGGGDEPENLVSLCAAHHLHGVHRGWLRVSGRAPDHLTWELGEKPEAWEEVIDEAAA